MIGKRFLQFSAIKSFAKKIEALLERRKLDKAPAFRDNRFSKSTRTPSKIPIGGRIKAKRHNYAMLLCYCGDRYYGMQRQVNNVPTVELHLFNALHKVRLINDEELADPVLFNYHLASRTDKGVSAVHQICSMILPLGGRTRYVDDDYFYTSETVAYPLNQLLPEDIRVIGVKRVTPRFTARRFCDFRHYTYTLPTYAFFRNDQANIRNFRISSDTLSSINDILSLYKGKHNFFNYTSQRLWTDASCLRVITQCQTSRLFVHGGVEFLTIDVMGSSFMLHQIRKMIGMCVAVVRGLLTKEDIRKSWGPTRLGLPMAPALGLVLHDIAFANYYKHHQETHESVTWNEFEDRVMAFREKYIDSIIVNDEKKEKSQMSLWLDKLDSTIKFLQQELRAVPMETGFTLIEMEENEPRIDLMSISDKEIDKSDNGDKEIDMKSDKKIYV